MNKSEESSSEEEESAPTKYCQLLDVFATEDKKKTAIDSESEDESSDEDAEGEDSEASEESENSENDDRGKKFNHNENDYDENSVEHEDEISPNEGENDAIEENDVNVDVSDDDPEESTEIDSFAAHYEVNLEPTVISLLEDKNNWNVSSTSSPELGNIQHISLKSPSEGGQTRSLMEDKCPDPLRTVQKTLMSAIPQMRSADQINLKQKLKCALPELSSLQCELLSVVTSYKDLLYTERSRERGESVREVYTLHCLNHVLRTRTRILNNNAKQAAREEGEERLRDQGFTRPKVLIIAPFRESCRRIVELIINFLFPDNEKGSVANRKRFNEDFAKIETARKDKPDDYYDTFEGNIDDSFKLGIAVTKKTLKLYTDFYSSDIIIASPLGLRLVTGVEGEDAKTDTDFLSSLEVVVVDQMEVLLMQNWDHLTTVLAQLHQQPRESHGVDYGRVRLWSLDGLARHYRQTLLFSSIPAPEFSNLWSRHCSNYMGRVRVVNPLAGQLAMVVTSTPAVWHRVHCDNLAASIDTRFKYFTEKLMPQFNRDSMYHTCVFVPSYFDFVRVRNWFKASDLDFSEVTEYSKEKRIAKARDEFYHNEKHFLLYTERAHFYRRFRLKGIRHLVFYQPPTAGWMYVELCNFLQRQFQNPRGGSDSNMSITVLYTKYDSQRLSLCVGSSTASTMFASDKAVHMFKPGE